MVLRLALFSSQFPWWYSDYPYTHNSLPGGTQTIPILITVYLVAHRLSLYSSQSTWWLRQSLYSSQSPWWYSDYPYTHHSLPGGTQTISTLITVSLVVLRLSLCTSHPQFFPMHITVSLVVHSISLYTPSTQTIPITISHQNIPILITVPDSSLRLPGGTQSLPGGSQTLILTSQSPWWNLVLRLSLFSSQSPRWYSDYPYTHHSLPGGSQTIPIHITVSLVVRRLSLY